MRRIRNRKTLGVNFISGKYPDESGRYQFWSVAPLGGKGWTFRARIHDGPEKRLRELLENPLLGIEQDWYLMPARSIDVFIWAAEHSSTDVPEQESIFRVMDRAKEEFPEQYAEMTN